MRNISLVLFLAAVMTVSACTGGGDESGGASIGDAFIGGTEALRVSFIENSPPNEVTDRPAGETGFPFDATVSIENRGEHGIQKQGIEVSMSGFFPGDFLSGTSSGLEQSRPLSGEFRGVSKDPEGNRIQGDIDQVTFPATGDFEYNKELKGNQQFPFRAEVCYPYQTKVLSQVCLMKDLTNKERPVCNPTGSKQVSNSGAPVHVTSVTQSVGGRDKLLLNFNVRKMGTAELFKNDATAQCNDDFQYKDRVQVTIDTGLSGLNCLGLLRGQPVGAQQTIYTGELLLSNGEASFTCIQELSGSDRVDSVKTFEILIDYYTRNSVTKNVLVKHII